MTLDSFESTIMLNSLIQPYFIRFYACNNYRINRCVAIQIVKNNFSMFRFTNSTSHNTVYADTLHEMDDVVGRITELMKTLGLYNNTVTWFTGDNGPWDVKCQFR